MGLNDYIIPEFLHAPHVIPGASSTSAGVMSANDKVKVDSIQSGGGYLMKIANAGATPFQIPATPSGVVYLVRTNVAQQNLTLPANPGVGTTIFIKDEDNASVNSIVVAASGSGSIDGAGSQTINTAHGCWGFVNAGGDLWRVLTKF